MDKGPGTQWVNDRTKSIWQYASPGFMNSGFAVYVTFKEGRSSSAVQCRAMVRGIHGILGNPGNVESVSYRF
jgi:hypothetical protein